MQFHENATSCGKMTAIAVVYSCRKDSQTDEQTDRRLSLTFGFKLGLATVAMQQSLPTMQLLHVATSSADVAAASILLSLFLLLLLLHQVGFNLNDILR